MDKAGVRGVRFNFVKRLVDFTPRDVLESIADAHRAIWAGTSSSISRCRICPSSNPSSPRCRPSSSSITWAGPMCEKGLEHPEFQRYLRLLDKHTNIWSKVSVPGTPDRRGRAL